MDHGEYGDNQSGENSVRDTRVVGLRASDADREETAELLRQHYTMGRLDTPEFEARVGRCYAAATDDDLRKLVADLPRGTARELVPERSRDGRHPLPRLAMVIPIILALVMLSALTGGHALWLAWPLAFIALRGRLVAWPARSVFVRRQG